MLTILIGPYEQRVTLRMRALPQGGSVEALSGDREELREKAAAASLFGETQSYLLRDVDEEVLLSLAPELVSSPHRFVCEVERMLAPHRPLFKKNRLKLL